VSFADGDVDVEEFLAKAVDFANNKLFGSLSCGMAVHPSVASKHQEAVHQAVDKLRYGSIAINTNPFIGYGVTPIPWGAWNAAGTPEDIGSGNVLEHTSMYDHAEKGVLWMPFTLQPKAVWHPQNTNMEASIDALIKYYGNRNVVSLSKVIVQALRST
jgi:hypothetical protein